jgi:hypothetical protein
LNRAVPLDGPEMSSRNLSLLVFLILFRATEIEFLIGYFLLNFFGAL